MAGSITFSGIGSGIDASAVADLVYDQYTAQNEVYSKKVSSLESESSALEELNTLMLSVADTLEDMRTINGGASVVEIASSNEAVVTAAADSSAQSGTYTVTVNSLAKTAAGSFAGSYSTTSQSILKDADSAGALNFTVGEGTSASNFTIAVSENTTAEGFVAEFNQKANGKATASLINTGTANNPSYSITFATTKIGTENGSLSVTADNDALLSAAGMGELNLEQATDAEFKVSGLNGTVTRSSNTVSDVISGVTLKLADEGSSVVTVDSESSVDADKVQAFVTAYNNLVTYINKEDAVTVTTDSSGNTVNSAGALAGTNLDDQALTSLRSVLHEVGSTSGVSLSSLGMTTNNDGTLSFDEDTFEEQVVADPTGAAEVITNLADSIGGTAGVINNYTGYGALIATGISSNTDAITQLNEKISDVEDMATKRQEATLNQFSKLEELLAQLNQQSSIIGNLLKF